ncbi:MAG: thiaminase II [Synergistaceae bacterium]|jgi:thiaminase/transcriptional activator TenA|nr:thiaminase II [Synergistaceae bacterium]
MCDILLDKTSKQAFSVQVFQAVQPILARILEHPFNRELANGTLSRERFCFYMQQDSLYLIHFARALAFAGSRALQEKRIEALLTASQNALVAERSLHEHYFAEFGVRCDMEENPACTGYTSFLLATVSLGSLGEALAALLPCFWIYREVGNHVARNATSPNPYAKWIKTYSDNDFSDGVDRFIDLLNAVADEAAEQELLCMKKSFMVASNFEYYFWDDAYHMKHMDCTL